ncbi:hypothetical protein G6F24_015822 [Rhizopus arrhizus]|nr:hypothetical protein G6F24_015822 [Rhizopus arrhizus]
MRSAPAHASSAAPLRAQPLARFHAVGQPRGADGALGDPPQWRRQAREQPEAGQGQRQPDRQQATHAAQLPVQRHSACMAFILGQALQGEQRADACQRRQHGCQRSLVEQERRKRGEQREAQQAAGIAKAAQLAGLDRQHRGQQGATGIAPGAHHAHLPDDGGEHAEHQQQAYRHRQHLSP